jgi:hypothetical protein
LRWIDKRLDRSCDNAVLEDAILQGVLFDRDRNFFGETKGLSDNHRRDWFWSAFVRHNGGVINLIITFIKLMITFFILIAILIRVEWYESFRN